MYGAVSFSLRSAGVLKAPRSIGEPLCDHATPLGPVPARPRSSAVGVTPVLWKPWSPPSSLTRPFWAAKFTDASVSSAPAWHLLHEPLPPKTLWPFFWLDVIVPRSMGVWSGMSVDT